MPGILPLRSRPHRNDATSLDVSSKFFLSDFSYVRVEWKRFCLITRAHRNENTSAFHHVPKKCTSEPLGMSPARLTNDVIGHPCLGLMNINSI